jgi:NADH-quinone oxidoreductase subunit G
MTEDLRKLNVNGTVIEAPAQFTLLQACELAGEEIPRFCFHERLSVAGNCRMCLVEVVGSPKPVASCAQVVSDLRPGRDGSPPRVNTNTEYVKKAREGVMEFLLINHPLDCPICDQGGECDLQDQALAYGRSYTRFEENKRAVEDKEMGPLVKTIMTRCIQCTRCVRFIAEVAGVEEIGMLGRGEDAEITTYLEASLTSELQGNIIDLCPVGALTSKPYAFNARSWELEKTETIDVMDALGSNIRVDARGPGVMRILPRVSEEINEEWISDKTRFVWDGLARQRLDRPYVRKRGKLEPASWGEALEAAGKRLKRDPEKIAAIAGDLADAESMKSLMDLMRSLGVRNIDCRQDGAKLGRGPRESWLFNTTIYGVDELDALLLIGTNPRLEAPVLNARIRGAWLENGLKVGVIGERADLTYPTEHLGAGPSTLAEIAKGGHSFFKTLKEARRAALILGQGALARPDGAAIAREAAKLAEAAGLLIPSSEERPEGWNGFNVLHTAASRVAGLDMGFVPSTGGRDIDGIFEGVKAGEVESVFLLGVDEIDVERLKGAFVIYLGSHGDRGASAADIVLPGAAYTEKNAIYVNTEGRVQLAQRSVFPKGEAREDWAVVRALSDHVGRTLPYDDLDALRAKLLEDHPSFAAVDYAPGGASVGAFDVAKIGEEGRLDDAPFKNAIENFYFTNPIARASVTLAKAAAAAAGARTRLQAAE